jgi:hypothetical protein
VSERPKEHASKACEGATPPWVQIPPLPPLSRGSPADVSRRWSPSMPPLPDWPARLVRAAVNQPGVGMPCVVRTPTELLRPKDDPPRTFVKAAAWLEEVCLAVAEGSGGAPVMPVDAEDETAGISAVVDPVGVWDAPAGPGGREVVVRAENGDLPSDSRQRLGGDTQRSQSGGKHRD